MRARAFELLLRAASAALLLDLHLESDLLLGRHFLRDARDRAIERVEQRRVGAAQVDGEVQLLRHGVEDVAAVNLTDVHHGAVGERLELQLIQPVDGLRHRLDRRRDTARRQRVRTGMREHELGPVNAKRAVGHAAVRAVGHDEQVGLRVVCEPVVHAFQAQLFLHGADENDVAFAGELGGVHHTERGQHVRHRRRVVTDARRE